MDSIKERFERGKGSAKRKGCGAGSIQRLNEGEMIGKVEEWKLRWRRWMWQGNGRTLYIYIDKEHLFMLFFLMRENDRTVPETAGNDLPNSCYGGNYYGKQQ